MSSTGELPDASPSDPVGVDPDIDGPTEDSADTTSPPTQSRGLVVVAWLVRTVVLLAFLVSMFLTISQRRPDLLRPTTFGSDTWNYDAAAERLVIRHPLYRLS